jgi:hypothetical protein
VKLFINIIGIILVIFVLTHLREVWHWLEGIFKRKI